MPSASIGRHTRRNGFNLQRVIYRRRKLNRNKLTAREIIIINAFGSMVMPAMGNMRLQEAFKNTLVKKSYSKP